MLLLSQIVSSTCPPPPPSSGENEPLIPAHAQFLLTTDSARVRTFGDAAAGADASQLNTSAYERYFDEPEVIRAYREQQLIQTPEFTLLSEHEAVGGRFRPRGLDDEGIDTSDAAYEKRHRKYEAFEKRQRLREKEKLKHEHYKLKERIEQLRALEPPAFLSAPDSYFASSKHAPLHRGESDAQSGKDVPHAPPHNEGEWRKRQMLDVANSLDARYRTLLDTAPSRAPDLPTPTPPPPALASATPLAHTPSHQPGAAVRHPPPTSPNALRQQRVLPLSHPSQFIELDSDEDKVVKIERDHARPLLTRHDTSESLKLRIKFPNRPPSSASPRAAPGSRSPTSPGTAAARSPKASMSPSSTGTRPKPISKNAAPGPNARVPFAKRVPLQDAAVVDVSTPRSPSPTSATLRRRPDRTAAHPKHDGRSPAAATAAGAPASRPQRQQQLLPAHPYGPGRLRKRPRVEPSNADHASDTDDEAVDAGAEDEGAEEEGEGEEDDHDDDDDDDDGGNQGQERTRWRDSALYREAQRHASAPNARKTHRHLGIFGLKGFPTEVEHLRDFLPPHWALPRGDSRLAPLGSRDGAVRGADRVRGGAAGGDGMRGDADGAEVGRRLLRGSVMIAAVTEDREESWSCSNSDQMVVETASAVDSQATELMIP